MNEKIYQDIFDELSKYLISGWEKLVIYMEYGLESYSFCFYIKTNGKYTKCYDIPGVAENDLFESFASMDRMIAQERAKETTSLWTNMTITVDADGRMHADLDYSNLSDGTYQYKKDWKRKYLI